MTLVDGDGYIFAPRFIKEGKGGGQLAASILNQELIAQPGRRMQNYAIVYLNRLGLAHALHSNDLIPNKFDLDDFIVGFNQASPLISIMDVGNGKEAADAKLKGIVSVYDFQRLLIIVLVTQRCFDSLLVFPK